MKLWLPRPPQVSAFTITVPSRLAKRCCAPLGCLASPRFGTILLPPGCGRIGRGAGVRESIRRYMIARWPAFAAEKRRRSDIEMECDAVIDGLISDLRHEFRRHKGLADKAMAPLDEEALFRKPGDAVNSVALIV